MKAYGRIKKIAKVVLDELSEKGGSVVADIGTDHGYLSELVSRSELVEKVIATDISEKCLDKVKKIKQECNLTKIETRLGDGLMPVEHADIAVIAGIGGFEIIKMLETQNIGDKGKKCDLFVLVPSQNVQELREWLFNNKIMLKRDFIIESAKRFYSILVVDVSQKQTNDLSIFNLCLGRDNTIINKEFIHYLNFVSDELEFVSNIPDERIENDENLKQKKQLKIMVDKMLNR